MLSNRDVKLKDDRPKELLLDKHEKYLKQYASDDSGTEQIMSEFLRMSGVYWGLNALYLMRRIDDDAPEIPKTLDFVRICQNEDGGFGAALKHDSHVLHTICAIQTLVILGKCDPDHIDKEKCVNYLKALQQPDGSFFGDKWGEVDTRFSLCALAALKLLGRIDAIDLDKAIEFVMSCNNQIDGGFGRIPGSESHTAYVYCCVSSLAIAGKLDLIDADQLGWWLSERQLPSGGLNGRPEKLPDLCYSWWCLASMKMIGRMHLIDLKRLTHFILACQDEELGGFSDRPGNCVDPYHTTYGVASLSLICHHSRTADNANDDDGEKGECDLGAFEETIKQLRGTLRPVNPTVCMPDEVLNDYQKSRRP